jgi:phosphoribosylaminoimidazole (AIR) synthetase
MGWGFAFIVDKADKEKAMQTLGQANAAPEVIGKITDTGKSAVVYQNKKRGLS